MKAKTQAKMSALGGSGPRSDVLRTEHNKRKRGEEEDEPAESRNVKRRESEERAPDPIVVLNLVSDEEFEEKEPSTQTRGKKRYRLDDEKSTEPPTKKVKAAGPPAKSSQRVRAWEEILKHEGGDEGRTASRFGLARDHFKKYGTAGITEQDLPEDILRALQLATRLEREAKESPAQAMKRMLSKRKRRVAQWNSSTGQTGHFERTNAQHKQLWAAPTRLDTLVYTSRDEPDEDKWSEGDEAATQEVVTEALQPAISDADGQAAPSGADAVSANKKRRGNVIENCRGWTEPEIREKEIKQQMAELAAARNGEHWKRWVQYTEANPDWREKEKAKEVELKKLRKQKREAAKKRELELELELERRCKEGGGQVGSKGKEKKKKKKRKGRKIGAFQGPKTDDESDVQQRAEETAVTTTQDKVSCQTKEVEKGKQGERKVPEAQDAAEPEGEFNLDDWVSDSDH